MKRYYDNNIQTMTDESPAELEKNGPETKYGIVTNSLFINGRKEPCFGSEVVEVLNRNDKVIILDNDEHFHKVLTPKNNVVYIDSRYIKEE